MKKIFLIIGLMISSFFAHAGHLEDVAAAIASAKGTTSDRERAQSSTQTVIRSYLSSQSGLMMSSAPNQYVGFLATKAELKSALSSLGYTFVSVQHRMEIYQAPPVSATFGLILMVYYDLNGKASELYLIDDAL
ncbi:MAG: hypothetical protein V4858_11240 [Pseudomonadota bacterium]